MLPAPWAACIRALLFAHDLVRGLVPSVRDHAVSPGAQESELASKNGAIKLVAGNSNPALAEGIGAYIGTPLTKAVVRRFADMEIFVEIQENVRGADVFVIQSTSYPANDHMMELLIIIAAPRLGAAHHGGDPLFRLCPAGPQTRAAHADLRQARCQPDHPRRRRPRA